ncbi:unnamed protein product [Nezara viridula]|uniref:Uncharacterized protein n=1 Tax=Nezara viridula TaxID=85310 RepID=A0A9P0HEW5_NEZVI|nr:unnamed protein product [Nezara viridula]
MPRSGRCLGLLEYRVKTDTFWETTSDLRAAPEFPRVLPSSSYLLSAELRGKIPGLIVEECESALDRPVHRPKLHVASVSRCAQMVPYTNPPVP